MAKKKASKKKIAKKEEKKEIASKLDDLYKNMPDEAKKKVEQLKGKLDKFQKQLLTKFDKYVMGITLLPPKPDAKEKDKVHLLVLMDDTDSKKMSKFELKEKLFKIVDKMGADLDKNLIADTIILSELWQNCYDAKYELLKLIATGAIIFDKGMLAAIKISEIHKEMVLKKFEKYIVSYVLAGSLVQGRATPESDIDVFIVIDDTDVKRMTRAELKDKLRAIIIGMGIDAGQITGIKNKLNVQVYILTDFWDNIKEANPIIFTFLRDGVPFYDRGIFMPWKQLLKMGRVKPSKEAIDIFMHTGDQMMDRIKFKLRDIGMEDTFYAMLTPSQAALMMYGVAPPTPKETPEVLREVFVKKEKILEDEYVKMLERVIKVRKDIEHGTKKELSGKEVDDLIANSKKYLERLKKLFKQIEKRKEEESVLHTYENVVTIIRDILRFEGIERVEDKEIITIFEREMIIKGLIPEKYLRLVKQVVKAKKDYDNNKLTKVEIQNINKNGRELIKFIVEYIQRKRGRELEKTKIRVKHGKKFGEVILLGKTAFIIHDIDNEDKDITKAEITESGSIKNIQKSSLEEFEKALTGIEIPAKVFIKEPIFEDLKSIFGKDVEILINY